MKMGNRTSGYGDLANPDFGATLSYHIQQESPDGSRWSAVFFLDGHEQIASRRFFGSKAEAEAFAAEQSR
jgi:hypothetical protein